MKTTDLPTMLADYFRDGAIELAHPRSFAQRLGLRGSELFLRGTKFGLKSVAVSFLILVPVFFLHNRVGKVKMYELVLLFIVVAYGGVMHLCLKLVGGSAALSETIGIYGYVLGVIAPGHILLGYPTYLKYGPELALATSPKVLEELYPCGFSAQGRKDAAFIGINLLFISAF